MENFKYIEEGAGDRYEFKIEPFENNELIRIDLSNEGNMHNQDFVSTFIVMDRDELKELYQYLGRLILETA
jgi:hypothetical protein